MARPKITLYVDTVSPFAYLAYHVLRHDAVFKGCDITYVPVFLGGLMHKCGNVPPIKIKNKDTYINTERLRWARHFSVPMTSGLPPDFPAVTLPIMRALCYLEAQDAQDAAAAAGHQQQQQREKEEEEEPQKQPRLIRALDEFYLQYWGNAVATHKPGVLKQTLAGLFGEAGADKILAESTTPAIKQALIANTDRAFESGAFGLPWMVCTNAEGKTEGFFGVDHLGQVAQFLGLPRPGEAKGHNGNEAGSSGWRALL
ncbi:thioredoxin-like protein [Thermothelomyces heterothallicus CBS 203.75]